MSYHQVKIEVQGISIDKTKTDDLEPVDVFAYEHGAVKLSLTPFSCRWDSGVAGQIFVKNDDEKEKKLNELIEFLNIYFNNDHFEFYNEDSDEEFEGTMEQCLTYADDNNAEAEFAYWERDG